MLLFFSLFALADDCPCGRKPPSDAYLLSKAVVTGEVVEVTPLHVQLKVATWIKGASTESELKVAKRGNIKGTCRSLPPESKGKKVLLFLERKQGEFRLLSDCGEDTYEVKEGKIQFASGQMIEETKLKKVFQKTLESDAVYPASKN